MVVTFLAYIAASLLAVVMPQDPNARVHDFAGLLSADQRTALEQTADDVEKQTTAQLAVVTVMSLDGKTVEVYANELFNAWGIGQKDVNNGVLLLVAPQERRMRIEVGRCVGRHEMYQRGGVSQNVPIRIDVVVRIEKRMGRQSFERAVPEVVLQR